MHLRIEVAYGLDCETKKKTDEYLMHYGVKGQEWGKRQYQDQDGNYTDEGVRHYRELRKKRQQYENSEEAARNKQITRIKSGRDEKLLSDAAETSKQIAHKIRLQEEQHGRSVKNMYDETVDDAVEKVMWGLMLEQYRMFNPMTNAVVRVGDDYVRGSYDEIKRHFKELISSGKDISDVELVSVDDHALTVYDVDDQGRVTNKWELGDDEIKKSKKNRTKSDR